MVDVNEEETNEFNRIIINMLDEMFHSLERNGGRDFIISFNVEDFMNEITLQNIMGTSMDDEHDKVLQKKDEIELKFTGDVYNKENDSCCVCLMDIEKDEYVDVCEGCKCINHYDCMNEWVKRKVECPNCRMSLNKKVIHKDKFVRFIEDKLDI